MKLRILLEYAAPYRTSLAISCGLMLIETGATLAIPWLGGRFAGSVLAGGKGDAGWVLLAMLALFAFQALLKFSHRFLLSRCAEQILADMRIRIYEHLQALPLAFYHRRRKGNILALLTLEVEQLTDFITNTLVSVIPQLVAAAGAVILLVRTDALVGLMIAMMIPFFYFLLKIMGRRLRPLARLSRKAKAAVVAIAEENLGMLPTIKVFTREAEESRRYRKQIGRLMRLGMIQERIYSGLEPAVEFMVAAAALFLLWMESGRVGGGGITPAAFVSLLLYAALLTKPISALANLYGQTQKTRGSLERMQTVLAEQPEPIFQTGRTLTNVRGQIEFRNLSFAYPGRKPVLSNINLTIRAGETLAITGENGAGKSSLAHLLMRLHEPDEGQIFIDGIDIADVSLRSLRGQVGIVPQHVLLFSGSVRDNIGYGRPNADPASIEQAARTAQAHHFITRLPQGYDTLVGDQGVKLSGGQRQRIALARALLKAPPILILDEATAMFDPQGEKSFIEECHQTLRDRTVILITHRPASLALADRVIRIEKGKVGEIMRDFHRAAEPQRAP